MSNLDNFLPEHSLCTGPNPLKQPARFCPKECPRFRRNVLTNTQAHLKAILPNESDAERKAELSYRLQQVNQELSTSPVVVACVYMDESNQ